MSRWAGRSVATLVAFALVVTSFGQAAAKEPPTKPYIPEPPQEKVVASTQVVSASAVRIPQTKRTTAKPVRVQAAVTTQTVLSGGEASVVPGTPVVVAGKAKANSSQTVRVKVLDTTAATKAKVRGVVFAVSSAQALAEASVGVVPGQLEGTGSADWHHRLRLVQLPECALTTPEKPSCQTQSPVAASLDDGRLTTTVSAAADQQVVLAAVADAAGTQGDFGATSLSPSGSWSQGGATGGFSWSYPITMVPAATGTEPSLALSYDSQAVDGQNSMTNNQSSWVGQGFSMATGYIERTYRTCADDTSLPSDRKTLDQCWAGQIITLQMPGTESMSLVRDDTAGQWHPAKDAGERIELLSGASNGSYNGEYWRVTTTDGTQYTFGMDVLPGGSSANRTNSAWTVPVYGAKAGDPCYSGASFAASRCEQVWRWNLDMVVDTHGNAITYRYAKETNFYGAGGGSTPVGYVRGGHLTTIFYGLHVSEGGGLFANAPQRVAFTVAERCFPSGTITCSDAQFVLVNANSWPDTPVDLNCAATGSCDQHAPSFWTRKRLTSISTAYWNGTGYQPVDVYNLTQSFAGDRELILDKIVRVSHMVGQTTITSAPVTLAYSTRANRVAGYNGLPSMYRLRLSSVLSETGSLTSVYYQGDPGQSGRAAGLCTPSTVPSDVANNTTACYPVNWTLPYNTTPTVDFFHKYVVTQVDVADKNGHAPTQQTTYTYLGAPAWHYDDNEVTKPKARTWGQFRGYQTIEVRTGNPNVAANGTADQRTLDKITYFRGMNGDKLPTGVRNVTITDSHGTIHTDDDWKSGSVLETRSYLDSGGSVLAESSTNIDSLLATTATRARSELSPAQARVVRPTTTTTWTHATGGSTTSTLWATTTSTYDAQGRLSTVTAAASNAMTSCVHTSYADNTTQWVRQHPAQVTSYAQTCPTTSTPSPTILAANRTYYDGATTQGSITRGDATRTETATGGTSLPALTWTAVTAAYDTFGRPTSTTFHNPGATPATRVTTTTYTPSGTGPLSKTVTTLPGATMSTTVEVEPSRGLTTKVVDKTGRVSEATYDAIGRTTAVWRPGQVKDVNSATQTYSYLMGPDAPLAVTTKTLVDVGNGTTPGYVTSIAIFDALGQLRQGQSDGVGGGRAVTDIFYDSHGWAVKKSDHWYTTGAPTTTLITTAESGIDDRSVSIFDGLGREIQTTRYKGTTAGATVKTIYGGDRITVLNPAGGITTTTLSDGRGLKREQWQYTTLPTVSGTTVTGGTYTTLAYGYDALGRNTSYSTAVGTPQAATWTTSYDLAGRVVSQTDPDSGTLTTSYYDTGEVKTTTDAAGRAVSHIYDVLGRPTSRLSGTPTGTQLASWTYDTAPGGLGQLASQSVYVDGKTYTQTATGYDVGGRPTGSTVSLDVTGFKPTYTTSQTWTSTGLLTKTLLPSTIATGGGSGAEQLSFTYNAQGLPIAMQGINAYVSAATYTPYGEPTQYVLGVNNATGSITYTRDAQTRRITDILFSGQAAIPQLEKFSYSYDAAGNITKSVDVQGGGSGAPVQTQCFTYDNKRQLTQAWSANDNCAANPSVSGNTTVAGPQPYWHTWTFDAAGSRTQQVIRAPKGVTTPNTTTTYHHTTPGHQHALTSTTTTGGATGSSSYTYNADGATNTRTINGVNTTFNYDSQGQLASTTSANGTTSTYIRDASGAILLRIDPDATTLYLPLQDIKRTTAGTITTTKTYKFNGTNVGVRQGLANVQYVLSDLNGTNQIAVNPGTWAVQRRYYDPYGNPFTGGSTTFPGAARTFLNAPNNPTNGLTDIGARHYDPLIGRFTSVDPIRQIDNPEQNNGYTYADNNPTTFNDPTGQLTNHNGTMLSDDQGGWIPKSQIVKTRPGTVNDNAGRPLPMPSPSGDEDSVVQGIKDGAKGQVTDIINTPEQIKQAIHELKSNPKKFIKLLAMDMIKGEFFPLKEYTDLLSGIITHFIRGQDYEAGVLIGKLLVIGSAELATFILGGAAVKAAGKAISKTTTLIAKGGRTTKAGGAWDLPPGGGGSSIGGRWYTEHALERVAPNTPEVMAILERRALARARAAGLSPGTPEFGAWWAKNGPAPRGVPPMVVEAEIASPGSTSVRVITNANGDVVTVIPR
ncbi:RHS repeat domain-containing protein [Aestuariimicrobium ganziense]|uniref:RHS repeat domain-containing protein n=1 Tax=Aestuariimicrobium ganziense TaxID=2773677 RepID=UPI00194110B7|nr:RHS repeat-associated core domain-containing protein [Aestuariimicrobium ganziense]